nr:hypothetical protein [Nonlabens sp. YIK11]
MLFFLRLCVLVDPLGGGNMFQANQAAQMVENITGGSESFMFGYRWVFGLLMAIFVGIVTSLGYQIHCKSDRQNCTIHGSNLCWGGHLGDHS